MTDSDGATNSTSAFLEVLKEADFKPKANAGEDKIIYLPTNTVTLNGNQSYDDHGIKSYEWTKEKGKDGKEFPADIQGSRSPSMTASNLEEVKDKGFVFTFFFISGPLHFCVASNR